MIVASNNEGTLISKVSQVSVGDNINVKVTDGIINARVESIGGK